MLTSKYKFHKCDTLTNNLGSMRVSPLLTLLNFQEVSNNNKLYTRD